jgi:hypothetical protein
MRRLVVEAECLYRRDHSAAAALRDEVRLFAYLTRQGTRERMLEQLENPLGVASE